MRMIIITSIIGVFCTSVGALLLLAAALIAQNMGMSAANLFGLIGNMETGFVLSAVTLTSSVIISKMEIFS